MTGELAKISRSDSLDLDALIENYKSICSIECICLENNAIIGKLKQQFQEIIRKEVSTLEKCIESALKRRNITEAAQLLKTIRSKMSVLDESTRLSDKVMEIFESKINEEYKNIDRMMETVNAKSLTNFSSVYLFFEQNPTN